MCGGGICISVIINDDSLMTEDCTFFFSPTVKCHQHIAISPESQIILSHTASFFVQEVC